MDDDYWVRNTNDRVRTLPVAAADADVFVLTASGLQHENFATFAAQAGEGAFRPGEAANDIFLLSVRGGVVTRVEQRFTP